jgi:hypothetical protein
MDKTQVDALAERIDRLEQECGELKRANRRLKRLGTLIVAGAVAVLIAGADMAKVIEVERIILREKGGQIRARLEVKSDGAPSLEFFDKKGRSGIKMDVSELGSYLSVHSKEGASSLTMSANEVGSAHFEVSVEDGQMARILASGKADNLAELELGKPLDQGRLRVAVHDDDAFVSLYAAGLGDQTLSLGADADGSTSLDLSDDDHKKRLSIGGGPDGAPFIKALDKNGTVLFQVPPASKP